MWGDSCARGTEKMALKALNSGQNGRTDKNCILRLSGWKDQRSCEYAGTEATVCLPPFPFLHSTFMAKMCYYLSCELRISQLLDLYIDSFLLVYRLTWWLRRWSVYLQCGIPGFNPWVGKISWRRKWQPAPVFLPGKSHGWRSLVGYSPWGHKVGHNWATSLTYFYIDSCLLHQ